MTKITKLITIAEDEFIDALKKAGWDSGDGKSGDEIRESKKPLFYKLNAPFSAQSSVVTIKNSRPESAMLYMLYGQTPEPQYADDEIYSHLNTFSLTIYYDVKGLFRSDPHNRFTDYIDDLAEALRGWAIDYSGEKSFAYAEDENDFQYRIDLYLQKQT